MLVRTGFIVTVFACALNTPCSAQTIRQVPLRTNDMLYDAVSNRLFASVPSSGGSRGNSITIINPNSATLGSSTFVGSEPNKLAISTTGQTIWVGVDGAAAFRSFNTGTLAVSTQFTLGTGGSTGPLYADDIAVVPGTENTVAISRRNQGFSPRHEGVGMYENGVVRPTTTASHTGSNYIEVDVTDPAQLWGYNAETTDFGFRRMSVNASGVTITNTVSNLISGFGADFVIEGGLAFSTTGRCINPYSMSLVGTYTGAGGSVAPDALNNRVFFLSGTTISIFNRTTFIPLGTISVPTATGTTSDLVRWGADGLAFRTSNDQVFLINSPLVPSPASALPIGALGLSLLRRKR